MSKINNTIAKFEPMYREANLISKMDFIGKLIENLQKYQAGTEDISYQQALKEEALEKGTLTILVTDFTIAKMITRDFKNSHKQS